MSKRNCGSCRFCEYWATEFIPQKDRSRSLERIGNCNVKDVDHAKIWTELEDIYTTENFYCSEYLPGEGGDE